MVGGIPSPSLPGKAESNRSCRAYLVLFDFTNTGCKQQGLRQMLPHPQSIKEQALLCGRCRQTFPGENLILRVSSGGKDWVLCSTKTKCRSSFAKCAGTHFKAPAAGPYSLCLLGAVNQRPGDSLRNLSVCLTEAPNTHP